MSKLRIRSQVSSVAPLPFVPYDESNSHNQHARLIPPPVEHGSAHYRVRAYATGNLNTYLAIPEADHKDLEDRNQASTSQTISRPTVLPEAPLLPSQMLCDEARALRMKHIQQGLAAHQRDAENAREDLPLLESSTPCRISGPERCEIGVVGQILPPCPGVDMHTPPNMEWHSSSESCSTSTFEGVEHDDSAAEMDSIKSPDILISLGPHTDNVLDAYGLADDLIPRLRQMSITVRHSRWAQVLQGEGWNLDAMHAVALSQALLADSKQDRVLNLCNRCDVLMKNHRRVSRPGRIQAGCIVGCFRFIFELILVSIICFVFWP